MNTVQSSGGHASSGLSKKEQLEVISKKKDSKDFVSYV